MPGIETLQNFEGSYVSVVTFRWRGMTICMALTLRPDGTKSLLVRPGDAATVVLTTEKGMAKWIISEEGVAPSDAPVSITCSGFAPDATE